MEWLSQGFWCGFGIGMFIALPYLLGWGHTKLGDFK